MISLPPVLLLLLPAACASGWLAAKKHDKKEKKDPIPKDYFTEQGELSKLLDELLKDIDERIKKAIDRKRKVKEYYDKNKGFLTVENIKYLISWLTDAFIVPILFEKKFYNLKFYYRNEREWKTLLKKIGFKVIVKPAHKGKPFSHIIFIATK